MYLTIMDVCRVLRVLILSAAVILPAAVQASPSLTIVYSGNLDGELEPCGCSDEGNFGGIKRRVTTLDQLREQTPGLIALSSGGLIVSEGSDDMLKSGYILEGFAELGYDAIGLQWKDLGFGYGFASKTSLPWVASNWHDTAAGKQQPLARFRLIKRNVEGVKRELAFYSWLDPDSSPMSEMKGGHSVVNKSSDTMLKSISAARNRGALTVLSTTLPLVIVKELLPLKDVDILLVKSAYEVFGDPKMHDGTLVLQPGSRGMRIARLDLQLNGQGRISEWNHKVIAMPEAVPDSQRMAGWYDRYNAGVKEAYLEKVALRKKMESGAGNYMGEEACEACHQAQYKIWQESQHAIAYEDLEGVNKAFDPFCIGCHVVGFGKEGGFVDMSMTGHLMNVQCESCHGGARSHVKSGGTEKPENANWPMQKMCLQCHVQKHSPSFNVEKYWSRIAH